MAFMSREALLGASDLIERDVELPSIGGTVRVRSLPASYSNQATSEALEMTTDQRGRQSARVNTDKLEVLQVLHGLVEPKLNSIAEAEQFAKNCGPAFKRVVEVIDEISGIDKEAIERTNAVFPADGDGAGDGGSAQAAGSSEGNGRSDLSVRAGA